MKKSPKQNHGVLKTLFIRYNFLLTLSLVAIVIVLGYWFILKPKYLEVSLGGNSNIETVKHALQLKQDYVKNLKEASSRYDQLTRTELSKLNNIVPDSKNLPDLFVQLEAIAIENRLIPSGINIDEVQEERGEDQASQSVKRLDISLSLIGDDNDVYTKVKGILGSLERSERLFDVNALHFNPESGAFTLGLFTYYH